MLKTHLGQVFLAIFGASLAQAVTLENAVSTDFTANFRETAAAAAGTVTHQSTEGGFLRASTAGNTAGSGLAQGTGNRGLRLRALHRQRLQHHL